MASPAPAAHDSLLERRVEWLGLRLFVPRDWEVVRHGLSPEQGSLVFVDRRCQRLTLSWAHCPTPPNVTRLLDDHQKHELAQGRGQGFEPLEHPRFRGFRCRGASNERLSRAVRYHAAHARLAELLFVEPPGQEREALFACLLDAFEFVHPPEAPGRVCCFDVDVEPGAGLRLAEVHVVPADTRFEYRALVGRSAARLRRIGMAKSWFQGDLGAWIVRESPNLRRAERRERTYRGAAAVSVEGIETGPELQRLLGRLRQQRTLAWAVPEENAVYQLTTWSPKKTPLLPDAFTVHFDGAE